LPSCHIAKADSGKAFFRSFEDIIAQERNARPLLQHASAVEPHLRLICETTVMPGASAQQLYRLDDAMLLRWLQAKVVHVHEGLQKVPTSHWHTSSRSSALVPISPEGDEERVPATTRLLLSFRLVADFLPEPLTALLRTSFGAALPTPDKKAPGISFSSRSTIDPHFLFRCNHSDGTPAEPTTDELAAAANKTSVSFQAKRLAKVNTKGFGKMTSFFKKRAKPNEDKQVS
jgi:Ydr279p protein family (RNase H2 complex component) wHTH domain